MCKRIWLSPWWNTKWKGANLLRKLWEGRFNYCRTADSWFWALFALFFKGSLNDSWLGSGKVLLPHFSMPFLRFLLLNHMEPFLLVLWWQQPCWLRVKSLNVLQNLQEVYSKFWQTLESRKKTTFFSSLCDWQVCFELLLLFISSVFVCF